MGRKLSPAAPRRTKAGVKARVFPRSQGEFNTRLEVMSNDLSAQLQARFQGEKSPSSPEPADVYGKLTQLITKVTGIEEGLERETTFEQLGIQSLDFIELTVRAEDAFKVRLEEETMSGISTIGELVNYLEEHQ